MFLNDPSRTTRCRWRSTGWSGQFARTTPWSEFAAFSILFAVPVSLVFFVFQRYIVGGLAIGELGEPATAMELPFAPAGLLLALAVLGGTLVLFGLGTEGTRLDNDASRDSALGCSGLELADDRRARPCNRRATDVADATAEAADVAIPAVRLRRRPSRLRRRPMRCNRSNAWPPTGLRAARTLERMCLRALAVTSSAERYRLTYQPESRSL